MSNFSHQLDLEMFLFATTLALLSLVRVGMPGPEGIDSGWVLPRWCVLLRERSRTDFRVRAFLRIFVWLSMFTLCKAVERMMDYTEKSAQRVFI